MPVISIDPYARYADTNSGTISEFDYIYVSG